MIWRQFLTDWQTLQDYLGGTFPDPRVLGRRAFLAERGLDYKIPDHFYKRVRDHNLGAPASLGALIDGTLQALSRHFLRPQNGRFVVVPGRFESWQHHLPALSPLVVTAFAIFDVHGPCPSSREGMERYVRDHVAPQFASSALPTVVEPMLDDLIRREGLRDLHVHLNGTTEVDKVWLDVLRRPDEFRKFLMAKDPREEVLEQYNQIEPGLRPETLLKRILLARRLRMAMVETITGSPRAYNFRGLIADMPIGGPVLEPQGRLDRHPIATWLPLAVSMSELAQEALWLILAFGQLRAAPDRDLAIALHAYLLLFGNFAPLCVQQAHQFGFDQFQKFTWNEVREMTEQQYRDRFAQMAYSGPGDLALVEGRFAPKSKAVRNVEILQSILGGFAEHHGYRAGSFRCAVHDEVTRQQRLDLRLVAHFIKQDGLGRKEVEAEVYPCRFHALRVSLRDDFRRLDAIRRSFPAVRRYLTGMDAAANELHAPPEVFAPLFRAGRAAGFARFTYHVGEDFEHLIGGIRAVWEALQFLDHHPGDRIGHGTAVGVSPARWLARTPERLVRRRGDWLDDLVFAHRRLLDLPGQAGALARLEHEIGSLSRQVYARALTPAELDAAWRLRSLDPLIMLVPGFRPLDHLTDLPAQEQRRGLRLRDENPFAFEIFEAYHSQEVVRRSLETTVVDAAIIGPQALEALQDQALEEVRRRRCAIEALPTSNVRISVYDAYHEHHLFRWLGLRGDGPCPPVCLGTDDPGIFATNMRNEFAHVLRELRDHYQLPDARVLEILRALNDNGRIYAFEGA